MPRTRSQSCRLSPVCVLCLLFTFLALSSFHLPGISQARGEEIRMKKSTRCPGQVLSSTRRYKALKARSVLECLVHCSPDKSCLSVVFDGNDHKCYLGNDTANRICSNMEPQTPNVKYYETKQPMVCDKKTEIKRPDGECECAEGFRGYPCTAFIGDCEDGYKKGDFTVTTGAVYTIHPLHSPAPFPVYCQIMGSIHRTYILDRRGLTTLNFNRSFAEYKDGFGDVGSNHWLGLEKIHQLTLSKNYELRVSAKPLNDVNLITIYDNFQVSDAADGYRLHLNQTGPVAASNQLEDCLTPLSGARFSTLDNDNDESNTVNCALKHAGGWWFRGKTCSTCNPTGPILFPADGERVGVDAEIFWTGDISLIRMTMYLVIHEDP